MPFFNSQFNYFLLIWMCHSRAINRLLERCLRVIYSDKQSSFSELLEKDGSVSVHMRNIESLAIEMFLVNRKLPPQNMTNILIKKGNSRY